MYGRIFKAASAALLVGAARPAAAQTQDRAITTVFGDSGVEQGNLYALPGQERPGTPYYSKDGFSRESNGPVWVEYLVPDITPLLGADKTTPHVNFAFSGATSGNDNLEAAIPSGLIAQVDAYAERRGTGAVAPGAHDVFVLAAGTNDFLRDFGTRDLKLTSGEVVSNVTASAKRLAAFGARTLIVEDVPNFLAAPAFNALPATQRPAIEAALSTLLDTHSTNQRTALRPLLAQAPADQQIAVLPLQKLFAHVLTNASALGFNVVNRACYDEASGTLCSSDANVQNSYLFFDSLHLTTRGQFIQALYYDALIRQLDGSAHAVPGRIILDTRTLADSITASDRQIRDRNWLATKPVSGVEIIADGLVGNRHDNLRFGIGYGNGNGWSGRLVGAHVTGATHFTGGGGHDLRGWGATASIERRIGHARIGVSLGGLWGSVRGGTRETGVPLLRTGYATRMSALFADLSAGWVWSAGPWQIVPSVMLRGDQVRLAAYSETGQTGLEMAFHKTSDTTWRGGTGLTIEHRGWSLGGLSFRPRLKAEYQRRIGGGYTSITGDLLDNVARPITATVRTSATGHPVIEPSLLISAGERVQFELSGRQTIGSHDRHMGARLTIRL